MNTNEIIRQLLPMFEKTPVVFWDDDGGEFNELLGTLPLEENGIILVRRRETSDLALKVRITLESNIDTRFLLYSQTTVPPPEKDWLLDIRMWAGEFHADAEALILRDIGLEENMHLRPYVKARKAFFLSKERREKLKHFVSPNMEEGELDLAMSAVITRCEQAELSDILLRVFVDWYTDKKEEKSIWEELGRYGLDSSISLLSRREYGYPRSEFDEFKPDGFMRALLVTDLSRSIDIPLPMELQSFDLGGTTVSGSKHLAKQNTEPTPQFSRAASFFCGEWRDKRQFQGEYIRISRLVEKELDIHNLITESLGRETKKHRGTASKSGLLRRCSTFECLERIIIRDIIENAENGSIEELRTRIDSRRGLLWAELQDGEEHPYGDTYQGLKAMLEIRGLREKYAGKLHFKDSAAFVRAYVGDLFHFDQYYRHFRLAADKVSGQFDVLKTASDMVEGWITDVWIRDVAKAWEQFFAGADGLLSKWNVPNIPRQRDFYITFPGKSSARTFVIISDALRYEVAEELSRKINSSNRFCAEISPMLGSLPSVTRIGMAVLLPHQRMTFRPDTSVLVDGMQTSSLEQRDAVMRKYKGIAILLEDLIKLKQEEARSLVREPRVVYIYHNRIDSRGDQPGTERETFSAAAETINELDRAVKFIGNRLNGSRIYITADHGFLYQDRAPGCADKATLEIQKPEALTKSKKRYALGHGLEPGPSAWHGRTAQTAGVDDDKGMEFLVPKGAGRFHFAGGARFTHGGAMPQEVIIPLISVKKLEGENKKDVGKVSIQVLGAANPKITSNSPHFELFQVDKVSDRLLPQTIEIFLASGTSPISDIQVLVFDSTSDSTGARKKSVNLQLKNGSYDAHSTYSLVLREKDTKIEVWHIPVTIDILFPSHF